MPRRLRLILLAGAAPAALALWLAAGPAAAQTKDETLADIRQELTVLNATVQGLRRELATTGGLTTFDASGTTQDRLDAIEAQLARLTGKTEELENRINRIVADGTRQISDLEFRLTELEGGDVSKLGKTPTLGGDTGASGGGAAPVAPPPAKGGDDLAVNEQSDFDRAKAALDGGDATKAAQLFGTFAETYTGGQLTGEALFYRGEALARTGDTTNAARAYLDSFSGYPKGPKAGLALARLGASLGKLGQTQDACVTLAEVARRYPGDAAVTEAAAEMKRLRCQ